MIREEIVLAKMEESKKTIVFICIGKINNNNEIHVASWIEAITEAINSRWNIYFAIEHTVHNQDEVVKFGSLNGKKYPVCYFPQIPDISCIEERFKEIFSSIEPDIIQCFGTEFLFTLAALNASESIGLIDKTVIFTQGICDACYLHYSEGVPEIIRKLILPKNILVHDDIRSKEKDLKEKSKIEERIIKKSHNIIGRTRMDKAYAYRYNPKINYFHCNDYLRSVFYEGEWNLKQCKRHSIFVSQYYYPLKGFHYLLKAVAILKEKYPDIIVYAAGYNPIGNSFRLSLRDNSYTLYLKYLMRRLQVANNIVFLGQLSAEQMKKNYLQANVFVMPSTIENSPNSLAEAMLLGVPCVASDVGGVQDYSLADKEIKMYNSSAYYMLADSIDQIFSNDVLAQELGKGARSRAQKEYNIANNNECIKAIYTKILKGSQK